jgi:ribosomal-protein-alanine N-acetyltransferase
MAFINQLSEKVFHIYGPYENIVYSWLESETTVTIIALMDRKPVGFAMIGQLIHEPELPAASELLAIAVEPEKQRLGIGEILLKKLEAEAADRHVKTLLLHTAEENLPAKKLFIRNGYQAIGVKRRFYPAGQDALLMCKEISGKGGS